MLFLKNAKIITMAGPVYENGYIIAGGGKILQVGELSSETRVLSELRDLEDKYRETEGVETIDARGGFALPGLIDAHCHVGMCEDAVGFEGEDGNEATDPVMPQLRAIDGIYHADRSIVEARGNGVTTVVTGPGSANVIGGQFAALKTYGRSVDEMILKEPAAMKVAFGENPKTVYHEKRQTPMTRMATAALLRENLIKAREYKERLYRHNLDGKENEKPYFDIKLDSLLKVLDREIPLKAHAHRADDILTAIRIAREFDLDITIEHCTEGHLIADLLKEYGVEAVCGPFLTDRSKIELRNLDAATPGILSRAGVRVAIMTDHPAIPIQYLSLCAAICVREGMDEMEALKAITINAAAITGIDDRVGSLEVGKDADMVVYDAHPFLLKSRVQYTIINGKVVYRN
jgi:imidazolonepropionase-like amidohydrolase